MSDEYISKHRKQVKQLIWKVVPRWVERIAVSGTRFPLEVTVYLPIKRIREQRQTGWFQGENGWRTDAEQLLTDIVQKMMLQGYIPQETDLQAEQDLAGNTTQARLTIIVKPSTRKGKQEKLFQEEEPTLKRFQQ